MKYINLNKQKVEHIPNTAKGWGNINKSYNDNRSYRKNIINNTYIKKVFYSPSPKTKKTFLLTVFTAIVNAFLMIYYIIISLIMLIVKLMLYIGNKGSSLNSPKWFNKLVNKFEGKGGKFEE